MLPGIPFDIVEGDDVHHRITDADGLIRICFDHPATVIVRELPNQIGGRWVVTTPYNEAQVLGCAGRDLWIGNARVGIPRTGTGAAGHFGGGRLGAEGQAWAQRPIRF